MTNEALLAAKCYECRELRERLRISDTLLAISVSRHGGQMYFNSDEDDFSSQAKVTQISAGSWKVEAKHR